MLAGHDGAGCRGSLPSAAGGLTAIFANIWLHVCSAAAILDRVRGAHYSPQTPTACHQSLHSTCRAARLCCAAAGCPTGQSLTTIRPCHTRSCCRALHSTCCAEQFSLCLQLALPYWTESDERVSARWKLAGVFALTLGTTGVRCGAWAAARPRCFLYWLYKQLGVRWG